MPTIPDPKFAALEMPWARAMQAQVESMAADLARRAQNDLNVNQGQNSTIQNLGEGIQQVATELTNAVNALTLTGIPGNIDQSRVVNSWTKSVNTTGTVEADGGLNSVNTYNTVLTTAFKAVYVRSDGVFGNVPSSVNAKQDIAPIDMSAQVAALLQAALVTYRYIEDVEANGDKATWQIGSLAEYFVALGLSDWVSFDENSNVEGILYERLSIPLIATVQSIYADLLAERARNDAFAVRLNALDGKTES